MISRLATIIGATFVSEDLTSIAVGLMIRAGDIGALPGIAACFAGIWLGDLGLWGAGRLAGRWARRRPALAARIETMSARLDRSLPAAVVAARFLPGTRLPLFLAAGALGRRRSAFLLWSLAAAACWTPILVMLAAAVGPAFTRPAEAILGAGPAATAGAALLVLGLMKTARLGSTRIGRARLAAAVSRLWRWEFWPAWILYPPVAAWIGWLSLRHGGFTTITAANPGIPDGGFVGESKHAILSKLPGRWTLPSALLPAGDPAGRFRLLDETMAARGWSYPIVLKPDAGQRGAGVRLIRSASEAGSHLRSCPLALLAQPYHPGPHEAGIFYYRIPGRARGRIFSVTDKRFPAVTGDGVATLEELIWADPRLRMQASTFLRRHAAGASRVPARGERVALAVAGNHAQGTMFRDGRRLLTRQLEARIDGIAREFEGFHFGRFDVRYGDVEAFRRGEDLAIVELNGITSESTDIYDPSRSILSAWRTLMRQWSLLFRIGRLNRRRGAAATPARDLIRSVLSWYRGARPEPLSD